MRPTKTPSDGDADANGAWSQEPEAWKHCLLVRPYPLQRYIGHNKLMNEQIDKW